MSTLFVVATPIGNLEDVTLRALRVLGEVGAVAAEDTRVTGRLLARHGLRKRMLSYRAPVEGRALPRVLQALGEGDVALVTDAGTPTLSDPGQRLVVAAWDAGHRVVPVPGPSAITAALAAAGFGGPGFCFAGYLPRKPGELRRFFESLREARQPTVAFDSPHRVRRALGILGEVLPERRLAVARELTKLHEEILRGTAAEVLHALGEPVRGEVTLVVSGEGKGRQASPSGTPPFEGKGRQASPSETPPFEGKGRQASPSETPPLSGTLGAPSVPPFGPGGEACDLGKTGSDARAKPLLQATSALPDSLSSLVVPGHGWLRW